MFKNIIKNIRFFLQPHQEVNIYIPQLNLIYISISKTGISSIRSMFLDKVGIKYDDKEYDTIHIEVKKAFKYISKSKIVDNNKAFKFSVVRNPFDRLVSCYKNKILEEEYLPMQSGYGGIFYKGMPFDKFVLSICKIPDIFSDRHFKSQYSYLYYKDNLIVDYLGKFENLDTDLAIIIDKYELGDIPHINKSKVKSDYKDFYTSELVEHVYNRYKNDIEKFNYVSEYEKLKEYVKE